MKKILCTLLLALSLLPISASADALKSSLADAVVLYADSNTALNKDSQTQIDKDVRITPIIENSRALVPVRFISECFGFNVHYDEQFSLVNITDEKRDITYKIGSGVMTVNGMERSIDSENKNVAAKIINGRTLIPVRSFAEVIGKQVFYDKGLIIIGDSAQQFADITDKSVIDSIIKRVNVLPVVGSAENLQHLLEQSEPGIVRIALFDTLDSMETGSSLETQKQTAAVAPSAAGFGNSDAPAHSETNVQVEGVDEADIVKTDGNYLYHVSGQKIVITKINPISQMSVVSIITGKNEEFYPIEVFVDNNKLAVISKISRYNKPYIYDSADENRQTVMPVYRGGDLVRCAVYDITDRKSPVLERTTEVEGHYLSARKIDNNIYIVANKYINRFIPLEDVPVLYRENDIEYKIGYEDIRYFPDFSAHQYISLLSIDIFSPDKKAAFQTLLGGGGGIYVSKENIFITTQSYDAGGAKTEIYKFRAADGDITYLKKGEVKGAVLNQFSMDEFDGFFRIATTSYDKTEQNNLYILDDMLDVCGKIEEIAPGERIFSARFVGEKGYIVTFKQVDPLFVLDLADPHNPQILGNLKIPGYSDYIHPVDENHLIGFGKDATGEGLYQGMKMALFDVTDVANPIQKFQEIIGDRGTESELLQNHKALLYMPKQGILAFPVTVREVFENDIYKSQYGQLAFSGAYIYSFDSEDGFELRGRISHFTDDDMKKLGNYAPSDKTISRIVYSGESLITISQNKLAAHSAADIKFQNEITITSSE